MGEEYKDKSDLYYYMINSAKDSKGDERLWLLYLRKVITKEKIKLSKEDINALLSSSELTMYQKATLERAVIVGTPTYKRVISLNEKAKLRYVELLKKRIKSGNI